MTGGEGDDAKFDDGQMMNMFKGLMGSLGEGGNLNKPGDAKGMPNDDQMNDIMKQF